MKWSWEPQILTEIADCLEPALGLAPLIPGGAFSTPIGRIKRIALFKLTGRDGAIQSRHASSPPLSSPRSTEEIAAFYKSWDWRRLRYDVLADNDGRCCLCGRRAGHGATLHVDHIKPLKYFWHLRLEKNNLQVLCRECNHGKASRRQEDWRGRIA
jgi:hypothetical protein